MKTKIICFTLSVVLALSMVGCGNNSEDENTANSNVSQNTQTGDSTADSSTSTDSQTEPSDSTNTPTDSTAAQENSADSTAGNTTNKPTEKPAVKPTNPSTKPIIKPAKPSTKPEEKPQPVILSATQVFDKITLGIEIPNMSDIDEQLFKDKYGIDLSLLDSYVVKKPMISANASLEISVLKVKDSKNIQAVIDAVTKRGTVIAEQEAWYPMEQELAQNRKIVSKGNYVILVILNDAETIVKNFNDLIKE